MSINYCTISNTSIDSFCGNRRQVILQRLVSEFRRPVVNPVKSGGAASWRQTQEKWVPPYIPTELERILVTATFNGVTGSASQDIRFQTELVTISNLQAEPSFVNVNIANLRVK